MKEKTITKPVSLVRVYEEIHKKVKIHVAHSGGSITDFVSNTLEKEIKNANKKKSSNFA